MRFIILSDGRTAKVDDEDYERLSEWSWNGSGGYAKRQATKNNEFNFMHRMVMNAPKNVHVDHINRDTLDNRKENLRFASQAENSWNAGLSRRNKVGLKGVSVCNKTGKYKATIVVHRRQIWLGRFDTALLAHNAYVTAAKKLHGKFARAR